MYLRIGQLTHITGKGATETNYDSRPRCRGMSLYSIGCTYPRPIHTVTESIQTTMNDLMVAVWVLLFVFAVLITDSDDW